MADAPAAPPVIDEAIFTGELFSQSGVRRLAKRPGPLKFPLATIELAPARILVARGKPVSADAEKAIARALAARQRLDALPAERAPVIAKRARPTAP